MLLATSEIIIHSQHSIGYWSIPPWLINGVNGGVAFTVVSYSQHVVPVQRYVS